MGIALALAGADVLLTDLPHVTPLARGNVCANCCSPHARAQAGFLMIVLDSYDTAVAALGHQACCVLTLLSEMLGLAGGGLCMGLTSGSAGSAARPHHWS